MSRISWFSIYDSISNRLTIPKFNDIVISKSDIMQRYRNAIKEKPMDDKIMRKFFLGFIQIHILHHAKEKPIYGSWMMKELNHHGYSLSPGTLYPMLHIMEKSGLLKKEEKKVDGKIRKYYSTTDLGNEVFEEAKKKAMELFHEVNE